MHSHLSTLLIGALLLGASGVARAQTSTPTLDQLGVAWPTAAPSPESPPAESPPPEQKAAEAAPQAGKQLELYQEELTKLRTLETKLQDEKDDKLRKQLELQRQQILLLEKMIRLLAEESKTQAATLEARARQGAVRDQELANATDDLREHSDAEGRQGPVLPAPLKELFLPTRTNQSPLAIFGTLSQNFEDFQQRPSTFPSPVFSPHLYLLLNEQFLLEANPQFTANSISLESAQLDWFFSDHATLVIGHFYSPLGFFTERLHTTWIIKTPDRPLLYQQVFPVTSFTGLQLRGATYLFDWPLKLEYASLVSNGFSLDSRAPAPRDFADLRSMANVFGDVNNSKAVGGRVGLACPPIGLIVGLSGLANGAYDRAGEHDLNSWLVDASWRYGNWDLKFEYARTHQQAPGSPIRREGFYAQAAYRPYECDVFFLQKLEGVVRFDYVRFDGINLAAAGIASFEPRDRIPVDRNRYTVGLNYYAYESLIFKVAYEFSDERNFPEIRDNGFLAQVAWGF